MADQQGATVEEVRNSIASEEFERKARQILVESADALKMEFHQRMETLEVLNHVTKLSRATAEEIKRTHDRRGQVAANRMLVECIFRPDDGIFELLQALISTGQSRLVRELLEKIRSTTRNATLIGILDGAPAAARGEGNISAPPGNSAMEVSDELRQVHTHPHGDTALSPVSSIAEISMPRLIDNALLGRLVDDIRREFGSVEYFYLKYQESLERGNGQ